MKRKPTEPLSGSRSLRRQPQVSCDSCRRKKLKCDRGDPCSSCRVRGIECNGAPLPNPGLPQRSNNNLETSILSRLAALEQAVFGPKLGTAPVSPLAASTQSSPLIVDHDHLRAAKFLDSAYNLQPDAASDKATGRNVGDEQQRHHSSWLVSQTEALGLLHDFFGNAYHVLPIVHKSSAEKIIEKFYSQLAQNGNAEINSAHAALILSISATTAFFWSNATACEHAFASDHAAAQASFLWRQSASDLLEKCQRAGSSCLEEAQARAVLAALLYNAEGSSAKFRFLHSTSVAACREIGVHLTDSPGHDSTDDFVTKEIKRRLWWHVVATDWLLGFNGGPLDGTYAVHPHQMNVSKPGNLNDEDLAAARGSWAHPTTVPTQMSCFLHRIRLGEVCRAVVDARQPGLPDVEIADCNQVLELDSLFENALAEFPPFLATTAPMPPGTPDFLFLQRAIIHLGFHSRRARLHRPLLFSKDVDVAHDQNAYQKSRDICLQSARTVLGISKSWLEKSLEEQRYTTSCINVVQQRDRSPLGPPIHRLGTVVSHLFTACAVIALIAKVPSDGKPENTNADMEEIYRELKHARGLLAAAGKESTVAGRLTHGLTAVLKRYRVKGMEDHAVAQEVNELYSANDGPTRYNSGEVVDAERSVPGADHACGLATQELFENSSNGLITSGHLESVSFELNGIWDDFLGVMPTEKNWDEIFAGLDGN